MASHWLASRLRHLGDKLIAKPQTFHVRARKGPLWEYEVEKDARWADELARIVQEDLIRAGLLGPKS